MLIIVCCLWATCASGQDVRVMSFNIRYGLADDGADSWEHRHDLVAQTIHNYGPDLLGIQEGLLFQVDYLKAELPEHGFVGVGRDDGANEGEMCGIFFRAELFEVLDSGHFWLSKTPGQIASRNWDASLTRMASWVILRTRDHEPVTFVFANTHFDHMGEVSRRESAKVIHRQLSFIAGALPVILTGDFNAPAESGMDGPYQVLTTDHNWRDTYRNLHPITPNEGTFNSFRGESSGHRIDWILTLGRLETLEAEINQTCRDGRYPSDHFPVTATICLEAGKTGQ